MLTKLGTFTQRDVFVPLVMLLLSKLVFGQELYFPIDFMVGATSNVLAAQDFAQQQHELVDTVYTSLYWVQQHQTMFANHCRQEEEFAVGDQVLLDASNLSIPGIHKFRQQFVGPFVVTACIVEVAYHLDLKGSQVFTLVSM